MKNLSIILLIASTLFLAFSCKKEEKTTPPRGIEYLPLQIYNYWEIQDFIKYTITGTKIIDNKTYFVFVQGNDTSYYRNGKDKIYVRTAYENESVKFDLTANVNDSWQFQSYNVRMISKTDTVTINHTKIPNCYQFFFDIPLAVDEEHSIWLAPGIGLIKMTCGFCPYPSLDLRKANINNQIITFP